MKKHVLVLDYSPSRMEAPEIRRWLPESAEITSLFIDTEKSFPDDLIKRGFTHIVHSGSELSINEESPFTKKAVQFIIESRDQAIPQFGICYGHQLVCMALLGEKAVRRSPKGLEAGWVEVDFFNNAQNWLGLKRTETVWHYHFDEVVDLPPGSEIMSANGHTDIQAFINKEMNLLGTQFHPEFNKEMGDSIFRRDREIIEKHHYHVDKLIQGTPSFDAGRVFFDFFLMRFCS